MSLQDSSLDEEHLRGDGGVVLPENHSPTSSSSEENSQTLHGDSLGDVSSAVNSPHVTSPISSPVDGGDISSITNSHFFKPGAHFLPNPRPRPEQVSPLAPRDLRPLRPRNGPGQGFHAHAPGAYGNGFRGSRTWISPDAQHHQEFLMVRNSMRRLFKLSHVATWKIADYTAHKEAMFEAKKAALNRAMEQKALECHIKISPYDPKKLESLRKLIPDASMEMTGNVSRVLGLNTIWCHDWENGKDEIAPWPGILEMKWEGDDRAKTGCGRFLPLPREQGPQGVLWNQYQVVEQYPLDKVQCIPTMEDVYAPVDEIDEEFIPDLLNTDVLEALEESL